MPRYYCDYCDTYLTHDSPSVRKQHNEGYKHKANVRDYYQQFEEQQTQSLIDQKVKEHLSGQSAAVFQQQGLGSFQNYMPGPQPGQYLPPMSMPVPGHGPPSLPVPGGPGARPPSLPVPGSQQAYAGGSGQAPNGLPGPPPRPPSQYQPSAGAPSSAYGSHQGYGQQQQSLGPPGGGGYSYNPPASGYNGPSGPPGGSSYRS